MLVAIHSTKAYRKNKEQFDDIWNNVHEYMYNINTPFSIFIF